MTLKTNVENTSESASHDSGAQEGEVFTIGDLARDFAITLRALRFYESRGLISPRRSGLTRLYSARDRARLVLILKGKNMGFTLQEIRALLASHEAGGGQGELQLSAAQIEEQLSMLTRQRSELDEAITELQQRKTMMRA